MEESARKQRNADRVLELWPAFRIIIEKIIVEMEARGFRPRIQDAHRSAEAQLEAFNKGNSKLKYGFHNVTGATGTKESLAVDMIDDDSPLASRLTYLLNLAEVARANGVRTGILWGLPKELSLATNAVIANRDFESKVKVGWDPTHIEPIGITPQEALAGKRI